MAEQKVPYFSSESNADETPRFCLPTCYNTNIIGVILMVEACIDPKPLSTACLSIITI